MPRSGNFSRPSASTSDGLSDLRGSLSPWRAVSPPGAVPFPDATPVSFPKEVGELCVFSPCPVPRVADPLARGPTFGVLSDEAGPQAASPSDIEQQAITSRQREVHTREFQPP